MSLSDSFKKLNDFDINDVDFNNAGTWPAAAKAFVVILVLVIIVGGGYWFFVADEYKRLDQTASKEQELRQQYESKAFQVANLEAFRAQMVEMEETFGALVRQLPSDTEVPGLLEDITNTATGSGLELEEIKLQSEQQKDFYVELPISLKVKGTYHEFATFVSSVAGLPRIVTLHDFSITPEGKGGNELMMQVLAKTYRYKSGE